MSDISRSFAEFITGTKAVRFGTFVLKSGKESNIFFDFGQIYYGNELITLGNFFADFVRAISGVKDDEQVTFRHLFSLPC